MSADPEPGEAPPRQTGRMVRLLRIVLALVLVVVVLVEIGWLTRAAWLAPLTQRIAEPLLAELLEGDVSFEHVGLRGIEGLGSFEVEVDHLRVTAGQGVLREIREAHVEAELDLGPLLAGDLGGLRGVRIRADRVELHIPAGDATVPSTEPDAPFDPAQVLDLVAPYLDLAPAGSRIDVRELVVRGADATFYQGPLSLRIGALGRERRVSVLGNGLTVAASAQRDGTALQLRGELADPERVTVLLGLEPITTGGTVTVDAELDRRAARGALAWRDGVVTDRGPGSLAMTFRIGPDRAAGSVDVDAPGVTVEADGVVVPLRPFHAAGVTAHLAVDLRDLTPWRPQFPTEWADEIAAVRGRIRAGLDPDRLVLASGSLAAPGLLLTIRGGQLPRTATGALTESGEIRGRLELLEPRSIPLALDLPDDTLVVEGGAASLTARGTLAAPELDGTLELGRGRALGYAWESLTGTAQLRGRAITLESATVLDARPIAWADASDGVDVTGAVGLTLDEADELESADCALTLVGRTGPWLDEFGIDLGLDVLDLGPTSLEAALRIADDGVPEGAATLRIERFRAGDDEAGGRLAAEFALGSPTADGTRPLSVVLDATAEARLARAFGVDDPLLERAEPVRVLLDADARWNGAELPTGTARLRIPRLAAVDLPDGRAAATVRFDGRNLAVDDLQIDGVVRARGEGSLDDLLGAPRIAATLDLTVRDTSLFAAFVPEVPRGGQGDTRIAISGDLAAPRVDAQLSGRLDDALQALGVAWPAEAGPPNRDPLHFESTLDLRPGEAITLAGNARLGADGGPPTADLAWRGALPFRYEAGLVALDGSAGDLELTANARLQWNEIGPTDLEGRVRWTAAGLDLTRLVVDTPRGGLRGTATLRATPASLLRGELANAGLEGRIDTDSFDLATLPPALLGGLGGASGRVALTAELGGTVAEPDPRIDLALRAVQLKLHPDVPSLDEVRGDVAVRRDEVAVRGLRGRLGAVGEVQLDATWRAADDTELLDGWRTAALEARIVADDALVLRATGIKFRTDADLRAVGSLDAGIDVTGTVDLLSGRVIRRVSLVPDLARQGGVSATTGIDLFAIPEPLGPALRFDVDLRTREPIGIVSHVLDVDLDAALKLGGTGSAPTLQGAIRSREGVLRLPALTLDVTQALVTFEPTQTRYPDVLVNASARRHGIDVRATASGRIDDVELVLTSMPPLTQEELYVLVTTGVLPDTLQQQGLQGRATMVGGYVAQEILEFYFGSDSTERGESWIDRFHFYSGREISRNGVESLTVDFDLEKDGQFALRGERDVYEDYNMGVVWRVRF